MEQNTCILPAANTGTVCFELAKDSNGNYPNNDEFYGNDCEASSTSFGQIGYNIINADCVTIGPNNRCENVYNCFQFPTDGSAVGIHILDPYISVSANSVVKPNEPSTSQVAIDNNGPNWLPSMHFGMNDLAGTKSAGQCRRSKAGQHSTTLYYWGGVSGTNINQAGSGIYAQQASASSPADATTQGSYNVKIGDNATAGLGINSGCIQVDATMNYTLAFRIAASSTGINFRPGFRFYSDPNCTEANKITSVATNARVLAPANYAGTPRWSAPARTGKAQRVAHLQQRHHLQLQRHRRGLARRHRKHVDAHAQFRHHLSRAQRLLRAHHRRAVDARLHPGKYRRESEYRSSSTTLCSARARSARMFRSPPAFPTA